MEAFAEFGAEALVCYCQVGEESVSSGGGAVEEVQKGGSGRLLLVGHVAVPGDGVCSLLEEIGRCGVCRGAVHDVHFGETLGRSGCWVDVTGAEVLGEVEGFLDGQVGEILLAEGDDFLLGYEQGEFVLAGLVEFGELHAFHFSADVGSDVLHFGSFEEVGEAGVCIMAVFHGLEGLVGRILDVVPVGQVVRVGSRCMAICAVDLGLVVG